MDIDLQALLTLMSMVADVVQLNSALFAVIT